MKIKGKVHCFFEQSGTFKNEFRKLGIPAKDYDIQNNWPIRSAKMTPKQYLQQLSQLKAKYKRALEDVQQIREMMESAGAIRYDKVNIQSSPDNDQLANHMIKLERAEKRSAKLADQYLEQYIVIREQIDQISPQIYSDILYLRYIHGMRLWDIAEELNYDYDWLRQLHGRALNEFGKVFADQLKEHTQTHIGV